MKKSYLMLVVIALTAIFATGCSSMNTSDAAKIADIGTNPVRYDVITSVQTHPVTGEASHSRLFWILRGETMTLPITPHLLHLEQAIRHWIPLRRLPLRGEPFFQDFSVGMFMMT